MASYADQNDLASFGINTLATQNIPSGTLDAELEAASRQADDYMRARYNLPLLTWPSSISMNVCYIAARNILATRGYNADAGSDSQIEIRYAQAIEYFQGIERQRIHPDVTQTPIAAPAYQLPQVSTGPLRGW